MRPPLPERLLPWIMVPLILFVLLVLIAFSMPQSDCDGEGSEGGTIEVVLIVLSLLGALTAVGGGLFRLGALALRHSYRRRDLWIAVAAIALLAVVAAVDGAGVGAGGTLAIWGGVMTGAAFLCLLAAAGGRLSVDEVGILLPIYLFGAACAYLMLAVLGLFISSGAGC
jgi:hypothetical protein